MAQEVVIDISADSTKAINSLSKIEEKLFEISEQEEKLKELISKTKDVEKLKAYKNELNKLKEVQKAYTKRQAEIKKSNDVAFGKLDSVLGGLPSKLKDSVGAVKTLSKGFGTLRTAVAATGIGALVIAVTAAVEWFSNFEAGVQLAEKAMNVFGAVVGQLGTALSRLLDGDFGGAADAILDIGKAAQEAARQTDALFEAQQKLFELQKRNIVQNEQLRQSLELQKRILEDTTLAENTRLEALERVRDISLQIQQNIIDETELRKAETEALLANENNYEKRRELELQLSEIQSDLIRQRGELSLIEKDAQKVEREIYALQRQKKNDQLKEEIELQKELKELLKVDDEELEKALQSDIDFLDKGFEAFQEDINRRIFAKKKENEILEGFDKKLTETQAQQLEIRKENEVNLAQESFAVASNAITSLIDLNKSKTVFDDKSAKQQFDQQKKLQLLQATVNIAGGIVSSFVPYIPVLSEARAAVVAAAGATQIGVIKKQQYQSNAAANLPRTSFGINTGGSGFTPLTPSIVSPTGVQDVNVVNAQSGVRAYVVENDITNSQTLTKTLNRRSRL